MQINSRTIKKPPEHHCWRGLTKIYGIISPPETRRGILLVQGLLHQDLYQVLFPYASHDGYHQKL